MNRVKDHEGHDWPVTGHVCTECRWPLIPINGSSTHPWCDPDVLSTLSTGSGKASGKQTPRLTCTNTPVTTLSTLSTGHSGIKENEK